MSLEVLVGKGCCCCVLLGDAYTTGIRHVRSYAAIHMNPLLARIIIPIVRRPTRAGATLLHSLVPRRGKKHSQPGPEQIQLWIQAVNPHGQSATSYLLEENADELAIQLALRAVREIRIRTAPGFLTAGQLIGVHHALNLTGLHITDL